MSITPQLRASARATYRTLFRAAATTFKGDDLVLQAFREKIRSHAREYRELTDAKAYAEQLQLGREVADVLRKNIVQGVKVDSPGSQQDRWRLRITEHTELGENESIKNPMPLPPKGSRRRKCGEAAPAVQKCEAAAPSTSAESELVNSVGPTEETKHEDTIEQINQQKPRKLNYSALKRVHKTRIIPELREEDLEESFVRGSGPGGQSINKTQNNVQLLHKPTGLRVSCQETRSLMQNRQIARKLLLEKLDHQFNPGLSKEDMKRAKQNERERRRRKKARKKAAAKIEEESPGANSDF